MTGIRAVTATLALALGAAGAIGVTAGPAGATTVHTVAVQSSGQQLLRPADWWLPTGVPGQP